MPVRKGAMEAQVQCCLMELMCVEVCVYYCCCGESIVFSFVKGSICGLCV